MAINKERPFCHERRSVQLCLLVEAVCTKKPPNNVMYHFRLQMEMNQRLELQALWVSTPCVSCQFSHPSVFVMSLENEP